MNIAIGIDKRLWGDIRLPAAKSVANRVALIRALCGNAFAVHAGEPCDDTAAMERAVTSHEPVIDVGPAGTAMRFATAYLASQPGRRVTLDGNERMRQRPIGPLVDALRAMGALITYGGREGYPSLHITGQPLHRAAVTMRGDVSSQFVSAVMMVMPAAGGGRIVLSTPLLSAPYVDMTARLMREFGVAVTVNGDEIVVGSGPYRPHDYTVEADWSAASYWLSLAAVQPGSEFRLYGLKDSGLQGDSLVTGLMRPLGVECRWDGDVLTVTGGAAPRCACPYFADLARTPDLAQTLAATLCLLGRRFRLTGLQSLRIKETDRLWALRRELLKTGFDITIEGNEALRWDGSRVPADNPPVIDPHGDHRMAMALAPAAALFPGLVINDARVVSKSYPSFWHDLRAVGAVITPLSC